MPRKADGEVLIISRIDNSKAQKDLDKLTESIEEQEKTIAKMEKKRDETQEKGLLSAAELDKEKAKLKELKDNLEEIKQVAKDTSYGKDVRAKAKAAIPGAAEEVKEQQERVRMFQAEFNKLQNEAEKYSKKIEAATEKLEEQKEKAGKAAQKLITMRQNAQNISPAIEKANKKLKVFSKRLREIVKSALIFSVVTKALNALKDWASDVVMANDEAREAVGRLKGALLTLVQPLVQVIIPAFTAFVNILTKAVNIAAQIMAMLFKTTAKKSSEAAQALREETDALKGLGDASKKTSKSLAAFDEINQLSTNNASSTQSIQPIFGDIGKEYSEDELKGILAVVAAIGAALLAWRLPSGLSDDVSKVAIGIGLIAAALGLLGIGFSDADKNGVDLQNTLLIIAGLIAGGLGLSLLTGSFIPLAVAAIAALVYAFVVAAGEGENFIAGLKEMFSGFIDFFKGIFTGDLELSLGGIEKIFSGFKTIVSSVIDSAKDYIFSFLDWLDEKTGGRFSGIIDFIKGLLGGLLDFAKTNLGILLDTFKGIFQGVTTFLTGVFTQDWDTAWAGLKQIFFSTWNGIIATVESAINLIIRGLNWLLEQINKISFTVPDWVPEIGGKELGFDIPPISDVTLPRLAQGAVIPPNREFLAVLGDNKTENEIVSPVSAMKQAFKEAAQEMGGLNGGTMTLRVSAKRGFARYLKFEIDAEDMRQGEGLVEYDTVYA